MKGIYPEYAERVTLLGVDVDLGEDAQLIRGYKEREGYPWDMAPGNPQAVLSYKVIAQATKFGIGRDGAIAFKAGYGVLEEATWREVFRKLTE